MRNDLPALGKKNSTLGALSDPGVKLYGSPFVLGAEKVGADLPMRGWTIVIIKLGVGMDEGGQVFICLAD